MAQISDFLNRAMPQPPTQEVGIGNFTAFVRVRDSSKLSADVPATPVESGSMVHDHIILKPLIVTIEGDVSDVHLRAQPVYQALTRTQAEIGNITSQYAPARTRTQVQKASEIAVTALDAVQRLDTMLANGEQVLALFGNQDTDSQSLQEQFINAMEALHAGRQIIAIDMPFRRRENMVITSFTTNTDNQTDSTSFVLEATQLRFSELQFAEVARPAAGTGGQLEKPVAKGTQEGVTVERSLLSDIFGG